MAKDQARHVWSEADDVAALYAYRFGTTRLGMTARELAQVRDISWGSFDMRMRNFGSVRGEGNLAHIARKSLRVLAKYGDAPEQDLRQIVLAALRTQ
jgi:hypothetical protein